mmetsp:Transcript_3704/g.5854  ORF Transcript_3704/g.5854 Transcript_3704/m.5854 type:complete len:175 (+) Transcript_3704:4040-4564(+)
MFFYPSTRQREIKNTKPYSEDSRKEAKEISKKAWKRLREWVAAATECEVDPFQLKIDCYKKLAEISEGGTKGLCILRMLSVSREMRVPREAVNKWIEKGYSWIEGSEDKYREYFAYFVFIIYWNMIYFKLQNANDAKEKLRSHIQNYEGEIKSQGRKSGNVRELSQSIRSRCNS